jgi:hypothetical protein
MGPEPGKANGAKATAGLGPLGFPRPPARRPAQATSKAAAGLGYDEDTRLSTAHEVYNVPPFSDLKTEGQPASPGMGSQASGPAPGGNLSQDLKTRSQQLPEKNQSQAYLTGPYSHSSATSRPRLPPGQEGKEQPSDEQQLTSTMGSATSSTHGLLTAQSRGGTTRRSTGEEEEEEEEEGGEEGDDTLMGLSQQRPPWPAGVLGAAGAAGAGGPAGGMNMLFQVTAAGVRSGVR